MLVLWQLGELSHIDPAHTSCSSQPSQTLGPAVCSNNMEHLCPVRPTLARTCTVGMRGSLQLSTRFVSTNHVSLRLDSTVLTKLSL